MKIVEPDRIEERIKQSKWYGNEEVILDMGKLIRCKDCRFATESNFDPETPYVCNHPRRIIKEIHAGSFYCAYGRAKDGEHE